MARIRSIKPDFFTSETIAALPLSARLTFIGLWTYVDDNGVGHDNEMLINAAIWPLEEDSLETLARTREDLATLSRVGLVTRFRDSRKRYLFIASWDEHQKVDHPRKPRYPRPGDEQCEVLPTCEDVKPEDDGASDSRESREDLAPDQGSGIRDQGSKTLGRQAGRPPEPGSDADPDFAAFWDAYPRKVAKGTARKAWRSAVRTRKADPKAVILAAERYRDDPVRRASAPEFTAYPASWLNGERWNDHAAAASGAPRRNRGFWED